ncbi:MAG TPA: hypothetical protein VMK12_11205 [Anaeromyxobacteraceae bacterium]|nr:hypothetical protein [Anaeromyxobacteraceae bacterium]
MLSVDESSQALERLFTRELVVNLDDVCKTLRTKSRMSVFRRLSSLCYLTSYSHAGRFYTLEHIPAFDEHGLWQHQGVWFSTRGSLKNTAFHLVNESSAGWTHRELRDRLRVRVHNALLDLVREKRIQREPFEQVFLYLSAKPSRANAQRKARRRQAPQAEVQPFLVVEILVEVVHGSRTVPYPVTVASRLAVRGIKVTPQVVESVYARYCLEARTTGSSSRRARR